MATIRETLIQEKVFLQNLTSLKNRLMRAGYTEEDLREFYQETSDDILMLYRNVSQLYSELYAHINQLEKDVHDKLVDIDEEITNVEGEIETLNNIIAQEITLLKMRVSDLESRMGAVEEDLRTMSRTYYMDLIEDTNVYTIEYNGEEQTFSDLAELFAFQHTVVLRGLLNGEMTIFYAREFDTDDTTGVLEWFATGLINNVVHEITVTMLPDDSVQVATEIQVIDHPVMIVHVTETQGDYVSDKSYQEVTQAITAGYTIVAHLNDGTDQEKVFQLGMVDTTGGSECVCFDWIDVTNDVSVYQELLKINYDNSVTLSGMTVTDSKYTAGTGISIDPGNVISSTVQGYLIENILGEDISKYNMVQAATVSIDPKYDYILIHSNGCDHSYTSTSLGGAVHVTQEPLNVFLPCEKNAETTNNYVLFFPYDVGSPVATYMLEADETGSFEPSVYVQHDFTTGRITEISVRLGWYHARGLYDDGTSLSMIPSTPVSGSYGRPPFVIYGFYKPTANRGKKQKKGPVTYYDTNEDLYAAIGCNPFDKPEVPEK